MATRLQSRTVRFPHAAAMLEHFGLPRNGGHYRRLTEGFRRVFASNILFGTAGQNPVNEVWERQRFHFFDHMRLWFAKEAEGSAPVSSDNRITLSEAFWEEIREHPVPVDLHVVRGLAHNPGCLDLYSWLAWRCHRCKGEERIPLFGPGGLVSQLGVQGYARERKFRERLRGWLRLVRLYWPECPAKLVENGDLLSVAPATAISNCAAGTGTIESRSAQGR